MSNSETESYDFLGEEYLEYYGGWHEPERLCLKSNYYHSLDYDISDDSYTGYLWKIEGSTYYPLAELEYYPQQNQGQAYVYKFTKETEKRKLVDSIIVTPRDDLIEYSRELAAQYWNKNVTLFEE